MTKIGKDFKKVRDALKGSGYMHPMDITHEFGYLANSTSSASPTVEQTPYWESSINDTVAMPTKLVPNAFVDSSKEADNWYMGYPCYELTNGFSRTWTIHRFALNREGGLFFRVNQPTNLTVIINASGAGGGGTILTPADSEKVVSYFVPLTQLPNVAGVNGEYGTGTVKMSFDVTGPSGGELFDVAWINIRPTYDHSTNVVDEHQAKAINIVGG